MDERERERETLRRTGSKDRQSGTQMKCQKGWQDGGRGIKIERPNGGRKNLNSLPAQADKRLKTKIETDNLSRFLPVFRENLLLSHSPS